MKHVFFVLIISVAAFVVGCQDSNMTGPVANSSHQLLKASLNTENVILKGDVVLNSSGTVGDGMVYHVNGQLTYKYELIGDVYEFSFNTQATLTPSNPIFAQGSVDDASTYQIAASSKQGVIYVQRDYYVPEMGTKFHMVFAIPEDNSLSVQSMWMDPINRNESKASSHGLGSSKIAGDVIFLNGEVLLKDLEAVDGSWMLDGQAAYTMTPIDLGVEVSITVDGMIKPKYVSGDPGVVTGQSTDIVQGIGNQPVILEKEYLFDCGNGDQRILHINFAVSESYISVDAMWVVPFGFGGMSAKK